MLKPPAHLPTVPPAPAPTVSTAPTAPTEAQSPDAPPRPAWQQSLQSALQRAEQRILENFRVPPGCG